MSLDRLRYAPTPLLRLAVVVLALVQFIAPTWHVCEFGGSNHCARAALSAASAARLRCVCEIAAPAPSNATVAVSAPDSANHSSDGNCLALMLMSMPGGLCLSNEPVALGLTRHAPLPRIRSLQSVAGLPQPPSRGPPLSDAPLAC